MLTDDEIRKAAEFAAEQMWPESGYVGWTEDDAVFHRKFIEACLEKLRGGVELPEPYEGEQSVFEDWLHDCAPSGDVESVQAQWLASFEYRSFVEKHEFTHEALLRYGAAQRLAAREQQWLPIESAPQGTMILCANMKAREAKDWCFVAWVVDGKVCGHRMDMPTHWQPLPPPPASPQEQK